VICHWKFPQLDAEGIVNAVGSPHVPTSAPEEEPPGTDTVGAMLVPVVFPLSKPVHAVDAQAVTAASAIAASDLIFDPSERARARANYKFVFGWTILIVGRRRIAGFLRKLKLSGNRVQKSGQIVAETVVRASEGKMFPRNIFRVELSGFQTLFVDGERAAARGRRVDDDDGRASGV